MKKYFFGICVFVCFISFQTKAQSKTVKTDSIKITGIALNAKAGAVVQTKEGGVYYVEGLSSWKETEYNKTVEVKGILNKQTFKQEDLKNEKGEWSQGMIGEKLTITKPIWKVLKN